MDTTAEGLESELRVSAAAVLAVVVAFSMLLAWSSEFLSQSDEFPKRAVSLFLLVCLLSGFSWLLLYRRPSAGRWLTVVTLVASIHLGSLWLDIHAALTLAGLTVALAGLLFNLPAAIVIATGESLLLGVLLASPRLGLSPSTVAVALLNVWATGGVMLAVHRPVRQLVAWVEERSDVARRLQLQASVRRVELEQTLEGLTQANRQLALAAERMAALRKIADDARTAKAAFVASVSHEFRTPLNLIIGLVELMAGSPEIYSVMLSPEMRRDLAIVRRNSERLSSMVNDILDLTQMEVGRLALHREQVDLKDIVGTCVEATSPLLEHKRLALLVEVPTGLPQVYCDRTRIEQVLLNLLSNAARFTAEGGVTVKATHEEQHVLVSVTDTGPGISPEDAAVVFEPFCQGTARRWRGKGGSGLGLSVSRRFVELHGGRMWLKSEPGAGAAFFFTLPIAPSIDHIIRPGHAIRRDWEFREPAFRAGHVDSADQLARPRLIICDENGALYPQLVRYSDGVELLAAQDTIELIEQLQKCPATAVVVNTAAFHDLHSVAQTIRPHARETPIIGCSVPQGVDRAVEAGALGYLVKPVTQAELEGAIAAVGKPVSRVLVVDDDLDLLRLFDQMLHVCDAALDVATASSGEEALATLRRSSFDLLLLDVILPDVDGWEMLESMAQEIGIERVPTFLVSAQDPADQPQVSDSMLITVGGGLSPRVLFRTSLEMPQLLLQPQGLDLGPL